MNLLNSDRPLHEYEGKKVLVTGGAGFVGSNLVRALLSYGADVTIIDDLFTGTTEKLEGLAGYRFIEGDVRNEQLIQNLAGEFEYVFHLAARNIIVSSTNPKDDYSVNIGGTLNLLMALRHSRNLKKFVYASSASVYGNPRRLPINEDDRTDVLSPYSVSKLGGEHYTKVFCVNDDLPSVIVRYSNVYGMNQSPGEAYCGVIGRFIEKVRHDEPPLIHGDGQQTRDFTYIEDTVDATLLAGIMPRSTGDVLNVGTGIETDINTLVRLIIELHGKHLTPVYVDRRDIDNIRRRVLNIDKIRQELRWIPHYTLKAGLEKTIAWCELKQSIHNK